MKKLNLVAFVALNLGFVLFGCDKETNIFPSEEVSSQDALKQNDCTGEEDNEIIPWGVTRVGGGINAIGKRAWIIDSGIDLTHPDLNVDLLRSISFVKNDPSPNDEFGHGTQVAGIIGAIKGNYIGIVGVAAGASVVSVRVFDENGNGTIAGIIAGIAYVAKNAKPDEVAVICFEVETSTEIDNVVLAAAKKGIRFVIAAGNNASPVRYAPAHLQGENIFTVSAMDKNDCFASFSNFGKEIVDYCAPGVEILSTDLHGGYSLNSGTSEAAPHLAGLLLLGSVHSSGNVTGDPDGIGEPIPHHSE